MSRAELQIVALLIAFVLDESWMAHNQTDHPKARVLAEDECHSASLASPVNHCSCICYNIMFYEK
jgi:hypothetical protein